MVDSSTALKAMIVQAQEEERYRLANYLQQGPAQLFANAAVEIETFLQLLDSDPDSARAGLLSLSEELRQALADIRNMIAALRPPLLVELGLEASLQRYVTEFSKHTGIVATLVGWQSLAERLPATMEAAIFRIIQEALENVRTHAHATEAEIRLDCSHEQLILTIADNGQGFGANEWLAEKRRLGLVAMSDRAELMGGQLQIFSQPARGVRVVLTVPLRGPGG